MTFAILTNTGRNKEAAAIAEGIALTITEMAWGDGKHVPAGGELALENEQGRKPVQASGTVPRACDQLEIGFPNHLLCGSQGINLFQRS